VSRARSSGRRARRGGALAASLLLAGAFTAIGAAPPAAPVGAPPAPRHPAGRATQARLENRTVALFGLGVHYLEGGQGRPVIFLHGLGGTSESWRAAATTLASGMRVFVPDQIGFGASDKPFLDYSIVTLVDFLAEFMDAAGLEKASLVGHSMGGRVASLFALEHPERVERLVLVDGAGYKPNYDPEVLRALEFNNLAEARHLLTLLYYDDGTRATDAAARRLFTERMRSGSGYTLGRLLESYRRGEGFADDLSPIGAPTLIVWGKEDEITAASTARAAQKQIKGSKLVLLERCGHIPMVEAPDELLAALKDFLLGDDAPTQAR
jgi:pimeloyl-ACP methyl ester carboxylesterase